VTQQIISVFVLLSLLLHRLYCKGDVMKQ